MFDDALAQHLTILFGTLFPALLLGYRWAWVLSSSSRQGRGFCRAQRDPDHPFRGPVWPADCAALAGLVKSFPALASVGIAGTGLTPALIAPGTVRALLLLVRGVVAGLSQPRRMLESAHAMGMSRRQCFSGRSSCRSPLPPVLRSLRVVAVQTVGMAALSPR